MGKILEILIVEYNYFVGIISFRVSVMQRHGSPGRLDTRRGRRAHAQAPASTEPLLEKHFTERRVASRLQTTRVSSSRSHARVAASGGLALLERPLEFYSFIVCVYSILHNYNSIYSALRSNGTFLSRRFRFDFSKFSENGASYGI